MSDEKQPEYVWAFPPERERKAGKVWLIIGLAVLAVAIAMALFWLVFWPGVDDEPRSTTSATASVPPSISPTPTAEQSAEPSAVPTPPSPPEETPAPEPPPVADPDLSTFQGKTTPILQDAETGLGIASESSASDAAQTIGLLQEDAARLSDTVAPRTLAERWAAAVDSYAEALRALHAVYERGENGAGELAETRTALRELKDIAAGR